MGFLPDFIWKFKIPLSDWYLYFANNDTGKWLKYYYLWYDGPQYIFVVGPMLFHFSLWDNFNV